MEKVHFQENKLILNKNLPIRITSWLFLMLTHVTSGVLATQRTLLLPSRLSNIRWGRHGLAGNQGKPECCV
jgi:hypothetical protein